MNKLLQTLSIAGFTCFSLLTTTVHAQQSKDKLGEFDEIIIKRKGNNDGKVTVEIKNGEVLVDGKKVDQYNSPDISVFKRKVTPMDGNYLGMSGNTMNGFNFFNDNDDAEEGDAPEVFNIRPNKALLGVITEKEEATGVTVKTVSPNSPAAKAGIKSGDIILRVDAKKIAEPKELYETIGTYAPGDKITVTYTRNKKETQTTVTLDERKEQGGMELLMPSPDHNRGGFFNFQGPEMNDNFSFRRGGSNLRLGLQVEDTEDSKGAKVTDVEEGSAAEKAGFQNDDIVTEFGGTAVKSARDVANAYRFNQQKANITAKVIRNGATQTLEVKIPKKINKVNL